MQAFPGDQWIHHDQIAKTSLLDFGGGTSLAITPSWQMFLTVAHSIEDGMGICTRRSSRIGVSRLFGNDMSRESPLGPGGEPVPEAHRPLVCTCSKTR